MNAYHVADTSLADEQFNTLSTRGKDARTCLECCRLFGARLIGHMVYLGVA